MAEPGQAGLCTLGAGVLQPARRGAARGNQRTWEPHQANAFTIPNTWQVLGAQIPGRGEGDTASWQEAGGASWGCNQGNFSSC